MLDKSGLCKKVGKFWDKYAFLKLDRSQTDTQMNDDIQKACCRGMLLNKGVWEGLYYRTVSFNNNPYPFNNSYPPISGDSVQTVLPIFVKVDL